MSEEDIPGFRRRILAEISDIAKEGLASDYLVERFTEYVTPIIAESGTMLDVSVGHIERQHGNGLIQCDAWAADLEEGRLDLVVTDFSGQEEFGTINRSRIEILCKRALRLLDFANKTTPEEIEPSSKMFDCLTLLKESLGYVGQIRLHYLTDSIITAKDVPDLAAPDKMELQFHKWDIVRLARVQESDREYEPIELDLIERFGQGLPCLPMPGNSSEYSGYLAILPGSWLAALYEQYSGSLMELNVRSFLQQKGKVNRGIRKTILEEPSRFLAYNNGISATVEQIKTARSNSGEEVITHLYGLQVVNGGQTVASIHRASKMDRCRHLDDIAVQAKITVVNPMLLDELVPKISRFSNTQNTVNEADFASNDSFHVEVERLSKDIWAPGQQYRWFYERARGQYQVAKSRASTTPAKRKQFESAFPSRRKFVKTDLARYQNAWDQLPYIVGLGTQKSFVHYMARVKKSDHVLSLDVSFFKDLVAKAIIYKKAESIARKHAFPAYRANAVAYTVALLSHKTYGRLVLANIWNRQDVSSVVEQVLTDWMPQVLNCILETANGRNVTEWAKKEGCWNNVKALQLEMPAALEAELSEGDCLPTVGTAARKGKVSLTTDDRRNIAIVMGVDSDTWWRITKWGQSEGNLTEFQCGLSNTLAGYAAGNWAKVPSAKQAKYAAAIVEELQQCGEFQVGTLLND
ncbi:AIPR family protein [Microbulbifer sp. EKSA005]|uniref:AIPR family protein n=1 Tax=Microbulbifer sp. EKSA005 TaxID=3243364 RepID=UPI004043167E